MHCCELDRATQCAWSGWRRPGDSRRSAIAVVDARRFIIPDELTAAALALRIPACGHPRTPVLCWSRSPTRRCAALSWRLPSLALRVLYRRIRGHDGIGLGDVKLAGVAGVWLDWWVLPVAIEIAALAALAVYAVRFLHGRRPAVALDERSCRSVSSLHLRFGSAGCCNRRCFAIPSAGLAAIDWPGGGTGTCRRGGAWLAVGPQSRSGVCRNGVCCGRTKHGEGCKAFNHRVGTLAFGRHIGE